MIARSDRIRKCEICTRFTLEIKPRIDDLPRYRARGCKISSSVERENASSQTPHCEALMATLLSLQDANIRHKPSSDCRIVLDVCAQPKIHSTTATKQLTSRKQTSPFACTTAAYDPAPALLPSVSPRQFSSSLPVPPQS